MPCAAPGDRETQVPTRAGVQGLPAAGLLADMSAGRRGAARRPAPPRRPGKARSRPPRHPVLQAGSTGSNDGHMKLSHPSITAHAAQERAEDQARLADQRRAEAEEARVTAERAADEARTTA